MPFSRGFSECKQLVTGGISVELTGNRSDRPVAAGNDGAEIRTDALVKARTLTYHPSTNLVVCVVALKIYSAVLSSGRWNPGDYQKKSDERCEPSEARV